MRYQPSFKVVEMSYYSVFIMCKKTMQKIWYVFDTI
jgi:hypothetical protein